MAGIATEYLLFGYAEGGLADIDKVGLHHKPWTFSFKFIYG